MISAVPDYNSIPSVLRRTYRLLDASERKKSVLMLLSIFVNSIVEILGLAFVVPVIGLVVHVVYEKILSRMLR